MTDKIQKIREEVEKIARSINPYIPDEEGKNSEYEAGRFAMATQIMQIIDSLQEEPVSSIWHDSNKEQPKYGSNVAIWNGNSGEIVTRCVDVYPDNLWAYMNDLLCKAEEPVSEDLEKAADEYADGENPTCPCEECLIKTFKAGAKWQKKQTIDKACAWLEKNYDSCDYMPNDYGEYYGKDKFIEHFRKAMEDN